MPLRTHVDTLPLSAYDVGKQKPGRTDTKASNGSHKWINTKLGIIYRQNYQLFL